MSILIKGMDMPKDDSGLLCIEIWPDGRVSMGLDLCGETVATAVEVSTPHGRLIDADVLKNCISERIIEHIEVMKKHDDEYYIPTAIQMGVNACLYELKMAPTVIEAEENEND